MSKAAGTPEDQMEDHAGDGKREGRPSYTFTSGAVYEGEWIGNLRDGNGVQTWPDGAKYEGEWKNNKAHGKGKFYHVDGDIFDGKSEKDLDG